MQRFQVAGQGQLLGWDSCLVSRACWELLRCYDDAGSSRFFAISSSCPLPISKAGPPELTPGRNM